MPALKTYANHQRSSVALYLGQGIQGIQGIQYHFKFFKGCLPQILLSPFLNTLTHLRVIVLERRIHFRKFGKGIPFH